MQIRGGTLDYNNYNYNEKNEKTKKLSRIILVFIVLIFIAIIAVMCAIVYINGTTFKVYVDGVSVNLPEGIILMEEGTDKVYVDIKEIASYLGYSSHNGEYKLYTEDTNKCWVYCENETASFFLNSNKISKVAPDTTDDYEDYTIEEPVTSKNGKLYCTLEGIEKGFNVSINYSKDNNKMEFYTLPYLIENYEAVLNKYGYEGVSTNFNNQKAILYDLFVVKGSNGLYGVINSNNKEIIGSRYSSIEFNENGREFYVADSSNKVGIVTETGTTKINLLYDSVDMVDKQNGLYLVKSGNKYGVLGNNGEIIIHLEYDQIGVDTSKFPTDNIKNSYVLYGNMIPVYQNKKWGFFDVTGNLIIPIEFDKLGYTEGATGNLKDKTVNNILIIPTYKAIVLGKENQGSGKSNKYGVYDYTGNKLIPCSLDNAYSIISGGVTTYYMEYEGNTLDIEKYLEDQKNR